MGAGIVVARKTTANNIVQGHLAERLAQDWLTQKGYEIIQKRWSCMEGELDLIAILAPDLLVFVEVRSLRKEALENISRAKQAKLLLAAQRFMSCYTCYHLYQQRFDVIAIDRKRCILHLENVLIS